MPTPREAALKAAVLDTLAKRVSAALAEARRDAEPLFAAVRKEGHPQVEITLPSGEVVGKVSIKAGRETLVVDENALLAWVKANNPEELESTVSPAALTRPDVIAYVRKLHPDLVSHKVRPAYRAKLVGGLNADGELVSETTGEVTKVAKTVKAAPTGEFAMTFEKAKNGRPGGRDQIANAWNSGDLAITDLLRPALEAGEDR